MTFVRSEGRSGKGAGKKDEKGKKNSLRVVDLPKKSDAGTSGSGRRSAAATVAPAAASTPKSAVSGSSLLPKPTIVTTSIGTESVLSASGNAVATDTNMKHKPEEVVSTPSGSSQFVSPATGLVVARVRHAAPGHAISVQERGQLARCVVIIRSSVCKVFFHASISSLGCCLA